MMERDIDGDFKSKMIKKKNHHLLLKKNVNKEKIEKIRVEFYYY